LRSGYRPLGWGDLVEAVALLLLAAAAVLLMTRRRRVPLGPLLAAIAVLFAFAHVSDAAVWRALSRGPVSEATRWLGVFSGLAIVAAIVIAVSFPLLLLPECRPRRAAPPPGQPHRGLRPPPGARQPEPGPS
jgi:hypothetical protein